MSPKTKKIIVVVVIVAIIAVGLWMVFKKPKTATTATTGTVTPGTDAATPAPVSGTSTASSSSSISFPLKQGSIGSGVKHVQSYLNATYKAGLTADGIWGPKTNAAALNYLKRDNVSQDVYIKWNVASF